MVLIAPLRAGADGPAPSFPDSARRAFLASPRQYALFASAAVLVAGITDRTVAREAPEASRSAARSLARLGERLGNPVVLAPALGAGWVVGRLTGSPALQAGAVRVGGAALGAGVACLGIKLAAGRARPRQSPDDADEFTPLRGNASFPSGHTTLAFAVASALDQETSSRWLPWVAYPAAALTGWSRLHDREHWMSDVVAGAALGFWAGREIDRRERDLGLKSLDVRPLFGRHAHGLRAGLTTHF
jgi:membrane-associated phospholipid phosphatase